MHSDRPHIFDRALLIQRRAKALPALHNHDFLYNWTSDQLQDRLQDITRDFPVAVQLGEFSRPITDTAIVMGHTDSGNIIGDEEFLPFAKDSIDLLSSNLTLHTANDLPGALIQINYALKPDGLFLGAMFGGETLYELRDSLMQAELSLNGGASPRVYPFADKQQMGGLMQRAGFALPVVDSDIITVTYPDIKTLFADLRGMGQGNIITARRKGLTHPRLFDMAEEYYRTHYTDNDRRLNASFEIIFLTGWAPHESQQQPLRPGSADRSLADELGTKEMAIGDMVSP